MEEKRLVIDLDKCVGCYACEAACRQEHGFPPESRWCRVFTVGPRSVDGKLNLDFVPFMCLHCDDPICSASCPPSAITKTPDGTVEIDSEKCTGCRQCMLACPYGAIYFDDKKKVAGKCSLCPDRVSAGLEPGCVQHCIGGSLMFLTEPESSRITRGMHTAGTGKVIYASSKWVLNMLEGAPED